MKEKDEKLEQLTVTMLEKLSAWRDVANKFNKENVANPDDVQAYLATDKAFTEAKMEWEKYLMPPK